MSKLSEKANVGLEEKIRREIDPSTSTDSLRGRWFWKLLTAAFFLCLAGLVTIVTIKLFNFFSSDSPPVPDKAAIEGTATRPDSPEKSPAETADEARPPLPNSAAPSEEVVPQSGSVQASPGPKVVSSYQAGDIYQDESGVWRNRPVSGSDNIPRGFYLNEQGTWQNREERPVTALAGLEEKLPPFALDMITNTLGIDLADLNQFGELFQGLTLNSISGVEGSSMGSGSTGTWPYLTGSSNSSWPVSSGSNPGMTLDGYEHFNPDKYKGPNIFEEK